MGVGGNGGYAGMVEGADDQNPSFPRKRESRDFCDRNAGIGRGALGSRSSIGVGDKLRGNDGGAVDSRFHGNDRWGAMAVGGDDRWVGMAVGGDDRWVGMAVGGNDRWAAMAVGGNDQNPSFPGKRGSRDLCDGKGGHWKDGLGFLVPGWGSGTGSGE